MPVRRHLHEKRGTVYASKAELDAWWKERGAVLADENGAEETSPPLVAPPAPERRPRRVVWVAIGFAAAVLAVGVVAWLSHSGAGSPAGSLRPLPFKPRDWVLVADFENRSGERLFDGTLDYALGRELSNSRYVNVVPRERVEDALRLMKKPSDSPINAALGREVCLRDGEIRALLTGRIDKLGARYLFSVELVDPKQGAMLAGFSQESAGTEGSLPAIRRISDQVRAALGEAPAPGDPDEAGLAKVTTFNLKALQLYSQADLLMSRDHNPAAAEELLRRAVAEDPDFASAWIHLAWTVHNQGKPLAEFQPLAETALRLSDTTTDRERYFIRGSYYQLLGEREKAIPAYEALLSLHPDHFWAAQNLTSLYMWMSKLDELPGNLEKAVQVTARFADSRPKDYGWNWNAGHFFVAWIHDPIRAAPYLRRVAELRTPEVTEDLPWLSTWLDTLPFTEVWLRGDVRTAASELDRAAKKVNPLRGRARDELAIKIAQGYLTLGKIEAAEQASEKIADPVLRNDTLAELSFLRGNGLTLRKRLQFAGDRRNRIWWYPIAILQARAGFTREAGQFLSALSRPPQRDGPELHDIPGEMALARGDLSGGISELEKATTLFGDFAYWNDSGFQLSSESLAAALRRKGDEPRAIRVLERASERRYQTVIEGTTGAYWMRNLLELARRYRSVGRVEDAQAIEADLRKLLALADADHPILLELQRLRKS